MSTYEYFEFRAVDRPLTDEEMHKLRQYSTRAQITPTSFSNEYNWGNFKGDPEKWMDLYFDAFVHVASWGTRWFMMRVPKRLIDAEVLAQFRVDELTLNEARTAQICSREAGLAQVSFEEVCLAKIGSTEVGGPQVRTAEICCAELSYTQIWSYVHVLCPPLVPCFYPLLENG